MHYPNLAGLIIFTGSLFLMFLTVPWLQIKRFALFGVVSGLAIAFALILVMQNWLGLWTFYRVDPLYINGIPLLLSAAWVPTEIVFAHFLSQYRQPFLRLWLIFFIPAISVGIHFVLIWNRMLTYRYWNLSATFLVSLAIHLGLALYLNRKYTIPL